MKTSLSLSLKTSYKTRKVGMRRSYQQKLVLFIELLSHKNISVSFTYI